MATEIIGNWQAVKSLVDNDHAELVFVDHGENYFVAASNGSFSVSAVIDKSNPTDSDLVDFETNYKSSANKKVSRLIIGRTESGDLGEVAITDSNSFKVAITDRPSEVRNRIPINKNIEFISISTTPTVVHTVTEGKTFYMISYILSTINEGNQIGKFKIRDGNNIKIPMIMPKQVAGAPSPINVVSPNFPEPLAFVTDVNLVEVQGDITVSLTIIGYEE